MTLGSHQTSVGKTQIHITPRWIIDRLGPFDLDPAAADPRPWNCAQRNFTECDDGLAREWNGRVWLNLQRLAEYGCGTALLHARTEADWFEPIWSRACGILFMADRIHFHRPDGSRRPANSGPPTVLIAFGEEDLLRLRESDIHGFLTTEWYEIGILSGPGVELAPVSGAPSGTTP